MVAHPKDRTPSDERANFDASLPLDNLVARLKICAHEKLADPA